MWQAWHRSVSPSWPDYVSRVLEPISSCWDGINWRDSFKRSDRWLKEPKPLSREVCWIKVSMVVSRCLSHMILMPQLFVLTTCSLWENYFPICILLLSMQIWRLIPMNCYHNCSLILCLRSPRLQQLPHLTRLWDLLVCSGELHSEWSALPLHQHGDPAPRGVCLYRCPSPLLVKRMGNWNNCSGSFPPPRPHVGTRFLCLNNTSFTLQS